MAPGRDRRGRPVGRRRGRDAGRRRAPVGRGERLGLVAICLAFVAVFVFAYSHGEGGHGAAAAMQTSVDAGPAFAASMDRGPRAGASGGTSGRTARSAPLDGEPVSTAPPGGIAERTSGRFAICHTGGGVDCVVDGDTAWIGGMKVRVADIDAPETHPPRCPLEAELGDRATRRLAELLNAGPFVVVKSDRDEDRYGRKLRVLVRNGRSLGDQLVSEGLARTWEGRRRPWC